MNIHGADPAIYSLPHVKHISRDDIVNFFRKAVFRTFVTTEKKSVITKKGLNPVYAPNQRAGAAL
ncbi:hypothetical protein OAM99_00120 [Planktomarina sp.]|nr:hypothetical protein [Planktomarina sp.]